MFKRNGDKTNTDLYKITCIQDKKCGSLVKIPKVKKKRKNSKKGVDKVVFV